MNIKKPIRVILTSPDLCGKTNIAAELSRVTGVPTYKSGREHSLFHVKDAQYNILKYAVYEQLQIVSLCNLSIIFDRFFPCEFVYSKVYHRNSDDTLVLSYDSWWNELGGKIVFLDKPEMDGDDELIAASKYQEIRTLYDKYKKLTTCKHITIDTSDYNLINQVNTILEFLQSD